jgi:hypothetical protein
MFGGHSWRPVVLMMRIPTRVGVVRRVEKRVPCMVGLLVCSELMAICGVVLMGAATTDGSAREN